MLTHGETTAPIVTFGHHVEPTWRVVARSGPHVTYGHKVITRARAGWATLALTAAALSGCGQPPAQVEGVKITAAPVTTPALTPTANGGLAVRLLPTTAAAVVGEPLTLTVQYADAQGGLVGTVEDFGDGGLGGLKIASCRDSEKNPPAGSKAMEHTWTAPGTYLVAVTVTTLSCVHGQEDVTATATVTVR